VLFLSVLIAVFIEILSPMPGGFAAWLKDWQPLVAATVALCAALFAAYVAYSNTTATLELNRQQETQRRRRKHAATRSVLPLALVEVSEYAERSALALCAILNADTKDILNSTSDFVPHRSITPDLAQPLPSETLKALTDFIEYSDHPLDVGVLVSTISLIQIYISRLRVLIKRNNAPSEILIGVPRHEIEALIIDLVSIYAGAVLFFVRTEAAGYMP
jgi:hypothetical protein